MNKSTTFLHRLWCSLLLFVAVALPTMVYADCEPITTFPWSTGFETSDGFSTSEFSATNLPECWSLPLATAKPFKLYGSYKHGGSYSLHLQDQTSGNVNVIVTPQFVIPEANKYQIRYWLYRRSSTYGEEADRAVEGFYIYYNTSAEAPEDEAKLLKFVPSNYDFEPVEAAVGWYEYTATIPEAGTFYIVIKGLSKYISSSYMDDLVVEQVPTCFPPTSVSVTASQNSVTIDEIVDPNNVGSYDYAIKNVGEDVAEADFAPLSDMTIGGLQPSSSYTLYIRSHCSDEDKSAYISQNFNTQCGIISADYFHFDFETTDGWATSSGSVSSADFAAQVANCWDGSVLTGSTVQKWYRGTYSGSYCLTQNYSTSEMNTLLVTPQVNIPAADTYRFKASVYRNGTSYQEDYVAFYVNSSKSLEGATLLFKVFRAINVASEQAPAVTADGWYEYVANLSVSGDQYIIIESYDDDGLAQRIDDLLIEPIPACADIQGLSVDAVDAHSVTLGFEDSGADSYEYALLPAGQELNESDFAEMEDYTISGLNPETAYTFYLRGVCGENRSAVASINFSTTVACFPISNLQIEAVTTNSVTISFDDEHGAAGYLYAIKPAGAEVADEDFAALEDYTVAGLNAATSYVIYIKADCGSEGHSAVVSKAFSTACDAMSVDDFHFDFETTDGWNTSSYTSISASTDFSTLVPGCWNEYVVTSVSSQYPWALSTSQANSGTHSLMFNSSSSSSGFVLDLVSPAVNIPAANAYRVSFWVYRSTNYPTYNNEYLEVFATPSVPVASDASDALIAVRRAVALDPVVDAAGWYKYTATIPVAGNINIVVRGHSQYGTYQYIDDLLIEPIPSCADIQGLSVDAFDAHSVTVGFEDSGADSYEYAILPAGQELNESDFAEMEDYTISGLNAATSYVFYLRGVCGENRSSVVSVAFNTACDAMSVDDFHFDFETTDGWNTSSYTSISASTDFSTLVPGCWNEYVVTSVSSQYPWALSTSQANSGTHSLMFNSSSSSSGFVLDLVSPAVNIPAANAYRVSFWVYRSTNYPTYNNEYLEIFATPSVPVASDASDALIAVRRAVALEPVVDAAGWYKYTGVIPVAGDINIVLRGHSQYGTYQYIDDLLIEPIPACADIQGLSVDAVDAHSVTVGFEDSGAEGYEYALLPAGQELAETDFAEMEDYTISGLNAETAYTFYVRGVCGENRSEVASINFSTTMACFPITNLQIDAVTTNSVTISFDDEHGAAGYLYAIKPAGAEVADEDYAALEDYTIAGLNASTSYVIYVKADCGSEGHSAVVSKAFATECDVITIAEGAPYLMNFNDYTSGVPVCWDSNNSYVEVSNSTSYMTLCDGSKYLRFNTDSYSPIYVTLPNFSNDLSELMISFMYQSESPSGSGPVEIGYMTDVNDPSTFTLLNSFPATAAYSSTTEWTAASYIFPASLAGVEGKIAIRYEAASSYAEYATGIDNIVVALKPSCEPVSNLNIDAVTQNSVTISFDDPNSASSYAYAIVEAGAEAPADEAYSELEGNTIGGLNASTDYVIYIKALCSDTDHSDPISAAFATECDVITIAEGAPYLMNFNSVSSDLPSCWNNVASNAYVSTSFASGMSAYDGAALEFHAAGQYVSLPKFSNDLSELRISLVYASEGTNSSPLSIGYMTDPADASTYVEIAQYPISQKIWQSIEVAMPASLAGIDANIAIKYAGGGSNWYSWIDNVRVIINPSCEKTSASVSNITVSSAQINIDAVSGVLGYAYAVIPSGNALSDGDFISTSETLINHEGLAANTAYDLYVKVICSATDESEAFGPVTFRTDCDILALPYIEDFEGMEATTSYYSIKHNPPCWTILGNRTTQAYSLSEYPSICVNSGNGNKYAYASSGDNEKTGNDLTIVIASTSDVLFAVLPQFSDNLSGAVMSFTYAYENSIFSPAFTVGYITDNDSTTYTAFDFTPSMAAAKTRYSGHILLPVLPDNARLAIKAVGRTSSWYTTGIDNVSVIMPQDVTSDYTLCQGEDLVIDSDVKAYADDLIVGNNNVDLGMQYGAWNEAAQHSIASVIVNEIEERTIQYRISPSMLPYEVKHENQLITTLTTGTVGDFIELEAMLANCVFVTAQITIVEEGQATALNDLSEGSIAVAPNPVKAGEQVTVLHNLTGEQMRGLKAEVFDINGKLINRQNIESEHITIDGFNAAGVYMLRLTNAAGNSFRAQVLVK